MLECKKIIYATNGCSENLFPHLGGQIQPSRQIICNLKKKQTTNESENNDKNMELDFAIVYDSKYFLP